MHLVRSIPNTLGVSEPRSCSMGRCLLDVVYVVVTGSSPLSVWVDQVPYCASRQLVHFTMSKTARLHYGDFSNKTGFVSKNQF